MSEEKETNGRIPWFKSSSYESCDDFYLIDICWASIYIGLIQACDMAFGLVRSGPNWYIMRATGGLWPSLSSNTYRPLTPSCPHVFLPPTYLMPKTGRMAKHYQMKGLHIYMTPIMQKNILTPRIRDSCSCSCSSVTKQARKSSKDTQVAGYARFGKVWAR